MCCVFGKSHIIWQCYNSTESTNLHNIFKEVSTYLISTSEGSFLTMTEQFKQATIQWFNMIIRGDP